MNQATPPTDEDLQRANWFKAVSSGANTGCVEVAHLPSGWVGLRDSKDPSKPPHLFNAHEWDCFLDGVSKGEFKRP